MASIVPARDYLEHWLQRQLSSKAQRLLLTRIAQRGGGYLVTMGMKGPSSSCSPALTREWAKGKVEGKGLGEQILPAVNSHSPHRT
jgi:hypothetical protein